MKQTLKATVAIIGMIAAGNNINTNNLALRSTVSEKI